MDNTGTFILYLSIAFAILLLLGLVKYLTREKYAVAITQHPEMKLKIIKSRKKLISLLQIVLWSSPLYLILLPWLMNEFLDINGYIVFVCMALMQINIFVEYLYSKWLYLYFSKTETT